MVFYPPNFVPYCASLNLPQKEHFHHNMESTTPNRQEVCAEYTDEIL